MDKREGVMNSDTWRYEPVLGDEAIALNVNNHFQDVSLVLINYVFCFL